MIIIAIMIIKGSQWSYLAEMLSWPIMVNVMVIPIRKTNESSGALIMRYPTWSRMVTNRHTANSSQRYPMILTIVINAHVHCSPLMANYGSPLVISMIHDIDYLTTIHDSPCQLDETLQRENCKLGSLHELEHVGKFAELFLYIVVGCSDYTSMDMPAWMII